jgi:type II secretory pathway component PulF
MPANRIPPSTDQLQSDYQSQTSLFAQKMAELQNVQQQMIAAFASIDPNDTATNDQWNSAYDKVNSAISAGQTIQDAIAKVEGWYQDAVNWTADQMWNVGHALGLNGLQRQQGMGGLGFVQAVAVAGVVASIAAWLAVAAVAIAAGYAAITAIQAHYNPTATQQYLNAHDAVYQAGIDSGMSATDALAAADAQYPPANAPVDTSSVTGTITGGIQQIAVYGILAWLALQIIRG